MSKPDKLKARQPRGFVDRTAPPRFARGRRCWRGSARSIRATASSRWRPRRRDRRGARQVPARRRPAERGRLRLAGRGRAWLALRYDLTAPLARVFAQHRDEPAEPLPALPGRAGLAQREAGAGAVPPVLPVRRRHRRAPARSRRTPRCARCSARRWRRRGSRAATTSIRVNNRKVLNGVMEAAALASDEPAHVEHRPARRSTSSTGSAWTVSACSARAADESGDFTARRWVGDESLAVILGYLTERAKHAELGSHHRA